MTAPWLLGLLLFTAASAPSAHHGQIVGQVTHPETREPIENALVVLQCACLQNTRETQTNAAGLYRFSGLPAGVYTVQVLAGRTDVSKVVELPPASREE